MSFETVQKFFIDAGYGERVHEFEHSSATVGEAALAVGCKAAHIAKTMSFFLGDQAILIVTAGDAKIDNHKFKDRFGKKAHMIPGTLVEETVGHAPGGVCPFVIPAGVPVYLDVSLQRFEVIYPAAGSANSAVELTPAELEKLAAASGWVDVCSGWQDDTD